MKKIRVFSFSLISALVGVLSFSLIHFSSNNPVAADAYNSESITNVRTIDLNDCTDNEIKSYYSSLTNKSTSEKQGNNLLKNLKTILKNGQKYFNYDGGSLWNLYEISDRDWSKSPARTGESYYSYNSVTNTITNYSYNSGNPYIHALYVNRDVTNETKAYGDHQQSQWGINQEHIWPKSQGFNDSGAGGARGDPMHLWAGNGRVNGTEHNNYMYGYVDTSKTYSDPYIDKKYANLKNNLKGYSLTLYSDNGKVNNVFEPQDCDKGDIARAIFYMVARYNYLSGSDSDGINQNNPNLALKQTTTALSSYTSSTSNIGYQGLLTDLLNWNHIDPPDEYEIHRNNLLYKNYTKNRNPFIDYPEWADYIWGTATYNGRQYQSYNSTPTGSVDLSTDVINGFKGGDGLSISKSTLSIEVGGSETISATSTNGASISWTNSNSSVASISSASTSSGANLTISALAAGNTTLTATVTINGKTYTKTCDVTVCNVQPSSTATLLTNVNDLSVGDSVAIVSATANYALSTTQNANNRGQTAITKTDSTIEITDSVQLFTVGNGTVSNTYSLYAENGSTNGYIYAAGSAKGSNLLKTQASNDANGSWAISISNNIATIVAQGANTNNKLQYNSSSNIFSCYSSSQGQVSIYKVDGNVDVTGVSLNKSTLELQNGTSETLIATVAPNNATDKSVTWSSSSPFIASVDANGEVTALDEGETTITVTTIDGGFSATCEVNVTPDTLASISIDSSSKTSYFVNEQFSKKDIKVLANYEHGSSMFIDSSECTFSISDGTTFTAQDAPEVSLTVTYEGKSTSVTLSISEHSGALYYLSGTSTVTFNNAPEGSTATFESSAGKQMQSGQEMTLTLSGYDHNRILGVSFLMKSNTSAGEGYLSVTVGSTSIVSIGDSSNPVAFEDESFNGRYHNRYNYLSLTLSQTKVVKADDELEIYIHSTENSLYCSMVAIDYEDAGAPVLESISLGGTYKTEFVTNDSFIHSGMVVTANYSDESTQDVTSLATWSNPDMSTTGQKTITVTYLTMSTTYTINVSNQQSGYVKVTSEPTSWEGTYLLVYEPFSYAWTGVDASGCHTDVTISDGVISSKPSSAVTLTIKSMTGGYSIKVNGGTNNGKYIDKNGSGNGITFSNTAAANTISYNSETSSIDIKTSDNHLMRFNTATSSGNDRFRYYTSGQSPVQLFKLYETSDLEKAEEYSTRLYECISCSNGSSAPTIVGGTTWNALKSEYNALSDNAKNYLINATFTVNGSEVTPLGDTTQLIAEGLARYDQLVARYSYENFINREISINSSNKSLLEDISKATPITFIVIISLISISCVSTYFYFKRRNIHN